jgi:Beta-ketoacyl synthase, N-terminal domain
LNAATQLRAYVQGVGFIASGIADWDAACDVFANRAAYVNGPLPPMSPDLLPAAERRRAGPVIRLALSVAQQAVTAARTAPSELATVFGSAWGDGENVHQICQALAAPQVEISPTRFHNSVQNAPSGYWSIATRSHAPSNTVNGLNTVFTLALLEAMVQVHIERRGVLLVCYDMPMPEPLFATAPFSHGCGVAMVLGYEASDASLAAIEVARIPGRPIDIASMTDPALEALRVGNPVAQALPLLQCLANGETRRLGLDLDPHAVLQVDLHAVSRAS